MSRRWDGDDLISLALGASDVYNDDFTAVVVGRIRVTADNTWLSFIEIEVGGSIRFAFGRRNNGDLYFANSAGLQSAGDASDSQGWCVYAVTGSTAASRSVHVIPIGGARTTAAVPALADGLTTASGTLKIGGDDDPNDMSKAAVALFDRELSTAELEGIASAATTQSIYDLTPIRLFDDSDAFTTDLMTAASTSVTGTTDDADDPTGWVYGLGGGGGAQHFGAASLDLTATIATAAKKNAHAAASVPLAATIVTAAKKDAHGASAVPLSLGISTAAKKLARAAAAVPLSLSVATSAKRSTTGAADLPLTLTVGSAGKKTAKGATTVPLALDVTTAAKKNANAAADLPLTLTITTVGATGGSVTGASSLELTFGAAVSGKRRASAAASLPLTVSVSTAAKKNAHAVSTVPVALTVTTAAKRDAHAAASLALTLTIDSAGEEDVPRSRATAGSARTGWAATTARTRGTAGSGR